MTDLTMATVVHNEVDTIRDLLEQARIYADELLVLDCASDDGTSDIASDLADKVVDRAYTGSSGIGGNKQKAIDLSKTTWIMFLDGDELLDDDLLGVVKSGGLKQAGAGGWWFRRKWFVNGLEWSYLGDDWQLRLLRREGARWEDGVHTAAKQEGTFRCSIGWILHRVDYRRFLERYVIYSQLNPLDKEFNDKLCNEMMLFMRSKGLG
jgi:glycosyltransferase involved in cell wall biosynthesis